MCLDVASGAPAVFDKNSISSLYSFELVPGVSSSQPSLLLLSSVSASRYFKIESHASMSMFSCESHVVCLDCFDQSADSLASQTGFSFYAVQIARTRNRSIALLLS